MRQPLPIILLDSHPGALQRFPQHLPVVAEGVEFTRCDVCRGEVLQVRFIQESEVRGIRGGDARVFVELVHGLAVDYGHVLRNISMDVEEGRGGENNEETHSSVLGIRFIIRLILLRNVFRVQRQRHHRDDALDVRAGRLRGDDPRSDAAGETAARAAANGEEFVGVAAVGASVLAGLRALG